MINDMKKKIILPQGYKELTIEKVYIPPYAKELGLVFLSEEIGNSATLRAIQVIIDSNGERYNFVQEVFSIELESVDIKDDFLNTLPKLNALEMLLLMNTNSINPMTLN